MSEVDWNEVRRMAANMSVEEALRRIEDANRYVMANVPPPPGSTRQKPIVDVKLIRKLAEMRANPEKYDTAPPVVPDGKVAVVDIFHPRKPGSIVAYENEAGEIIEEVVGLAEDSEVLRVRRRREKDAAAQLASAAPVGEQDVESSAPPSGDHGGGCSSSDV